MGEAGIRRGELGQGARGCPRALSPRAGPAARGDQQLLLRTLCSLWPLSGASLTPSAIPFPFPSLLPPLSPSLVSFCPPFLPGPPAHPLLPAAPSSPILLPPAGSCFFHFHPGSLLSTRWLPTAGIERDNKLGNGAMGKLGVGEGWGSGMRGGVMHRLLTDFFKRGTGGKSSF